MGDSLSNTPPVVSVGGFPRPNSRDLQQKRHAKGQDAEREQAAAEQDGVELHGVVSMARRMLRERVLARTRESLDLTASEFVPKFAENVDEEPVSAFLGRLIGAQNQIAALRVGQLTSTEIRVRLDRSLRDGISEAMEMLSSEPEDRLAGCEFVANVLAEYSRRIAELMAGDS
jgi:hypothetical protein